MSRLQRLEHFDSGLLYALVGTLLGLLAPVGWILVEAIFFPQGPGSLWTQTLAYATGSTEAFALQVYMGLGTAVVLGSFGFFLGQYAQNMRARAKELDQVNQTVLEQKEAFEEKFRSLNDNLKKFHASNARIQKSLDRTEVLRLAADALHHILGYDRVNILMLDRSGNRLTLAASRGCGDNHEPGISYPFDHRAGVLFLALRDNHLQLVEDIGSLPAEARLAPPWDSVTQLRSRSFIICPIALHGQAIGLFAVDNKTRRKALDETDVDTVRLFADQVSATLNKIQLLDGVETLVGQLQLTFGEMKKYRAQFAGLVGALKTGATSSAESVASIAASAEVVRSVVDDTVSATSEISMAVEEVTGNLDRLQQFMEISVTAMTEITATAREVEANATRSHETSERVKQQAEDGVRTVNNAFEGLQGISLAVDEAIGAIDALAKKGEEIEQVIAVIREINQKTNLLSLNASIIAAQSGENGRSFAVVAEEIRKLSLETGQSAGDIGALVEEIRTLNRLAVANISETRKLVDRDVGHGRETELVLGRILTSSAEAMTMTKEIRKATTEQVRSAQSVSRSIEELGDMSSQLTHASREESQGIRRIVQAVEEIKSMAEEMVRTTARQSQANRKVDDEVDLVEAMAARIFAVLGEREGESYRVIEQLEAVKGPAVTSGETGTSAR